jgi:hypothetical protein
LKRDFCRLFAYHNPKIALLQKELQPTGPLSVTMKEKISALREWVQERVVPANQQLGGYDSGAYVTICQRQFVILKIYGLWSK